MVGNFLSPAMYICASTKTILMSGSVFQASIHFRNASTDTVCLPLLPSLVYWYRCCIVSISKPQHGQRLVVTCTCNFRIVIVDNVLLIYLVMKCAMWTVVVSRARLNDVRLIPYQSTMRVSFQLDKY